MNTCFIGVHKWVYKTSKKRVCKYCGKTQTKEGLFWKNA